MAYTVTSSTEDTDTDHTIYGMHQIVDQHASG